MLGQAAFFHALHEVPCVVFLELGRANTAKVVHEIEVEILDAQVLKRLLQLLLKILGAVATRPSNALVGDIERNARITLDERLAQRCLAVGISPCRVEVVSTSLHVGVDHLRGVLDVDRVVLAARETHATKPEFANLAGIKRHASPLSLALPSTYKDGCDTPVPGTYVSGITTVIAVYTITIPQRALPAT